MDNWAQVTESGRGTVARRLMANYQMGLGHYQEQPSLRGQLGHVQSDINQRAFYRRWAELMQARSWKDISLGLVREERAAAPVPTAKPVSRRPRQDG
jgi:hypothetical protein